MKRKFLSYIALILSLCLICTGCSSFANIDKQSSSSSSQTTTAVDITQSTSKNAEPATTAATKHSSTVSLSEIPEYSGSPYVEINNNQPDFSSSDLTTSSYEEYSDLDYLGRCGVAVACIGVDLMPTEKRGEIGQVKPTGWHTVKYDCVDGKYLYNRCHLIGYQLSGENANPKNLITGTRYLNVDGMLPFENMVADYVKETNNHALYRVTPVFEGNNLLAKGVQIEAYSVEDEGDGICFNVFCYNVQPDVSIDYATGESSYKGEEKPESSEISGNTAKSQDNQVKKSAEYVLNTSTKKFHLPSCSSAKKIKDSNKETYNGSRDELISKGYEPCKNCNP